MKINLLMLNYLLQYQTSQFTSSNGPIHRQWPHKSPTHSYVGVICTPRSSTTTVVIVENGSQSRYFGIRLYRWLFSTLCIKMEIRAFFQTNYGIILFYFIFYVSLNDECALMRHRDTSLHFYHIFYNNYGCLNFIKGLVKRKSNNCLMG